MPALLTPEAAADEILAGYRGKAFEIHFPKRFTCFMKLLALLPARTICRWCGAFPRLSHECPVTAGPPDRFLPDADAGGRGAISRVLCGRCVLQGSVQRGVGVAAIQGIFRHMYRQISEPRFDVTERIEAANGVMLV